MTVDGGQGEGRLVAGAEETGRGPGGEERFGAGKPNDTLREMPGKLST